MQSLKLFIGLGSVGNSLQKNVHPGLKTFCPNIFPNNLKTKKKSFL